MSREPLLRVDDLAMHFPVSAGVFGRTVAQVRAVDGVSFELRHGRTLGLVGESGCGKTTVGQSIVRLLEPTAGRLVFDGRDITHLPQGELRDLRRELQIIFQDPFGSLNPRMTVAELVGEALEVHGVARGPEVERRVVEVLARVGVPASWINRYPHEFSGGQRQRISIARAIVLEPKMVVCDEAVSALDVSIQAQVINLLMELQREMQLAYLFISHDLSVVRHIADDVAVMYLGQIVESAPTDVLFETPAHPYSRALLSSIPLPDPSRRSRRTVLEGDVPTPLDPPSGCRFRTRCPAVMERCRHEEPPAFAVEDHHRVKCWHAEGLAEEPDWFARIEERIAAESTPATRVSEAAPSAEVPHRAATSGAQSRAVGQRAAARRSLLRRLAGAAAGAAGVSLLLGRPVLAGLLAALGLSLGRLAGVPVAGLGAAAGALVVCAGLGFALAAYQRDRAAEVQLAGLHRAIAAFIDVRGHPPARLADLGWRLPALFAGDELEDPWGSVWSYRAPGEGGRAYDLTSRGPDGAPGGGDDLGDAGAR